MIKNDDCHGAFHGEILVAFIEVISVQGSSKEISISMKKSTSTRPDGTEVPADQKNA